MSLSLPPPIRPTAHYSPIASAPFRLRDGVLLISEATVGQFPSIAWYAVSWDLDGIRPGDTRIAKLAPFPLDGMRVEPDPGQPYYTGGNRGRLWGPGVFSIREREIDYGVPTLTIGGQLHIWSYSPECSCTRTSVPAHIPGPRERHMLPSSAYFALSQLRVGSNISTWILAPGQTIPPQAIWAEQIGTIQAVTGSRL